jgi:hypothetical protein
MGSGWGPLCEFLGKEVPEIPYPRSDDWFSYKKEVEDVKRQENEGINSP